MQFLGKRHIRVKLGDGGKISGIDREIENENIAEKKLGGRNRRQSDDIGDPVKHRVPEKRYQHTQNDRNGYGNNRGVNRQKQCIG